MATGGIGNPGSLNGSGTAGYITGQEQEYPGAVSGGRSDRSLRRDNPSDPNVNQPNQPAGGQSNTNTPDGGTGNAAGR